MSRKMSKAALTKLQEKGVNVKIIKRPAITQELNAPPVAVPEVQEQNTPKKPVEKLPRKWKVDEVERNFDGWITSLTITETT